MRTILEKKPNFFQRLARRSYPLVFAFMATMLALPSSAGIVLPDEPLVTGARIPPNILFIMDDSGSMGFDYLPDTVPATTGYNVAPRAFNRNLIHYDPSTEYLPWVDSTGTTMVGGTSYASALAHITNASGTINLSDTTRTFFVPKTPSNPATFANGANYWRYQILVNGSFVRSDWVGSPTLYVPSGFPKTGLSGANNSLTYHLASIPTFPDVDRIQVTISGNANARLLVRQGANPTTGTNDCYVNNTNLTKVCTFDAPISGWTGSSDWHIGIRGNGAYAGVSLTVTYTRADGCSGTGWGNCTTSKPTARSEADERKNYATWYSYHRTRAKVAKAGSGRAFAEIGSNYRVGYRTIHAREVTGNPLTQDKPIPVSRNNGLFSDPNGIASNADNNRTRWYQRLYATTASGGTPLRDALNRAGIYFESDTTNTGPWGPESLADQYSCRQNFTILTTDGYRNDGDALTYDYGNRVGEQDNTDGLPIYNPITKLTYQYAPELPYSSGHANSLADIAMRYWKTDLRTDLANLVPVSAQNRAFWQHMVTFAVSIGAAGTLDPDVDLPDLTLGSKSWPLHVNNQPQSIDDLWHATVNGRGSFVVANKPDDFTAALKDALGKINERVGSFSNVAANSTSLDADTRLFQAKYTSALWKGELSAYAIDEVVLPGPPAVTVRTVSPTASWDASAGIPVSGRKVFSSDGIVGTIFPAGATVAQLAALTRGTGHPYPVTGADNAAYIAGTRTLEQANSGSLRNRSQLLGDIVNSSPAYVKDTNTVYVGANDGMLHAIDASDGKELFAFIPNSLNWGNLRDLSDPEYLHKYFVDGAIVVSNRAQTPGKNILVGMLGKGGRGIFALDVSTPASFSATSFKWERTGASDPNLGIVEGKPIIAKLNDGSMALIVSNGLNSDNDRAVLLVYDLESGSLIKQIDTGVGSSADPNGLSAPVGWDSDGNGTLDYVYAGDMLGNVWKFNLSGASSGWSVANAGSPLFTATDAMGLPQPITSTLSLAMHPVSYKTWVFFGTGRFMTPGDMVDQDVQSVYGFVDDGTPIVRNGGGANITARSMAVVGLDAGGRAIRGFESNAALPPASKGWYVDLVPPSPDLPEGERVVSESQMVGNVLVFASVIPTADACSPDGKGYVNALDAFTGTSTQPSFFDLNNNGNFYDDTLTGGGVTVPVGSVNLGVGMPTLPNLLRGLAVVGGSTGGSGSVATRESRNVGRVSWREVIRN